MEETEKHKPKDNIWGISNNIVKKNTDIKNEILSDLPNEDKVASNINGYVINAVGNIVAQFGFFVENQDSETIDMKISPDGFLAKIYNENTNIILGYGHPLGFKGIVDPKKSQILHLGPDAANGEDIIVSISNDKTLEEQGVVFLIRDIDVETELLSEDVKEDFEQSLEDAKDEVTDLNEIEASYNAYMRHIYVILGEEKEDTTEVEEEEIYE